MVQRLMGLIGLLLVVTVFAFSGVAQASGTGWSVVSSPNASPNDNVLQAVAAVSTNKVWAVGYAVHGTSKNNVVKRTLIERYNGTNWHIVASPNVGTGDNVLTGVAVISGKDAWAVGYSSNGGLVLHFDGLRWQIFSAPSACQFNAITAISANDVWAVGKIAYQPCAEHFDGTSWTLVHTPTMGSSDNTLLGVSASSSTNVWAVGTYCTGNGCDMGGGVFQTMIFHYDSSHRWSVVASPNPSIYVNQLNAVTVISATDAWAVGSENTSITTSTTLIEHFDGTSWTQVVSPTVNGSSSLTGIAAASATDIYAVGSTIIASPLSYPTVIEHFDGNSWSLVSNTSPGTFNTFNSVVHVPHAALGNAQFWAVGAYNNNTPNLTLTERDI
jgi:hypothetical protein